MDTESMQALLEQLGLSEYTERLVAEGFDSWETLLDITESDLNELGVKLGHRRKLQRAISERQGSSTGPSSLPSLASVGKDGNTTGRKGTDLQEHGSSSKSEETMLTKRPKRRYKRHAKTDPNAPVRPVSAYVLFSNDVRDKAKSEGQELGFSEMAKVVGERWQALSLDDREQYEQTAAAQKSQYNSLMGQYKKTEQYREHETYLANFRARNSGLSGQGEDMSEEEGKKRTRLEHDPSMESKGSNGSHLSLELTSPWLSTQGDTLVSPRSVGSGSGSDIYSTDCQNPRGPSPSQRSDYRRTLPQSPPFSTTSTTFTSTGTAGPRPPQQTSEHHGSSDTYQPQNAHPEPPQPSSAYPTYPGLPNYSSPYSTAASSSDALSQPNIYPPRRKGAPATGFERTIPSGSSFDAHMSFRTLPPPVPSQRTAAGPSPQPSLPHRGSGRTRPGDPMEALLAAAESQAPMPSPKPSQP